MKVFKTILVQLFTGINIATVLLLWTCCAVTYFNPAVHPRLSLFTLTFPAFLLVNVLFIFFWLIFKVKRVWIPLAGMALCGSFVHDYIPVNWPSAAPDSALTILSYNTNGFGSYGAKTERQPDAQARIQQCLLSAAADIICLQEAQEKDAIIQALADEGYQHYYNSELLIFSRLPILSADTLPMYTRRNHCVRAFLLQGTDTVMLINQHLESNRLSPEVKAAYREALQRPDRDSLREDLRPMLALLTAASPYRAQQTDSILRIVREWLPRPLVLCGDFNDTPVSYTHRVLTSALTSAFCESGNGLGFTYHEKGFPVRIDHILFDGDTWRSYQTHVIDTISSSDHYPILTKLARRSH